MSGKTIRNYKYRIYPTYQQEKALVRLMSLAWRTYNDALNTRIVRYQTTGETLSHFDLRDIMCAQRKRHPDFGLLMSSTVDALCKRVVDSYTGAFSRLKAGDKAGFPSQVKRHKFGNIPFVYGKGAKLFPAGVYDTKLRITNVGYVEMRYHRPIPDTAKIKRIMITRDNYGRWFAVLAIEWCPVDGLSPTGRAVGIDIGMVYLLAMSDGITIGNPRWYESESRKRRILGRKLDRQRRANNPDNYNPDGTVKTNAVIWRKSNRQRDTEQQLRKLESRVANRRKYFWHFVTDWLTREYDLIAIEDLSLEFMQQNKRLAMGVYDAAYATFWRMLEYKALERGVQVIKVPPQYTSQTCSECGHIHADSRKTQARFRCVSCGYEENADTNAAKNILYRALEGDIQSPQGVKQAVASNLPCKA